MTHPIVDNEADAARFRWAINHFTEMTAIYYNCASDDDMREQIDAAMRAD